MAKAEKFKSDMEDVSDMADDGKYYGGILFNPSIDKRIWNKGLMYKATNASHFQGVGRRSNETKFEIFVYDTINNIVSILISHFVGTECEDTSGTTFSCSYRGFEVSRRVTIVDQEKSMDKCCWNLWCMHICSWKFYTLNGTWDVC